MTGMLARWRVALGFLSSLVVIWLAQPTSSSLVAGGLIGAAGETLRMWAAGHINKSREVTTSGPYRFFAHPLYVGSSIMGIGLGIACGSVLAATMIVSYLAVTLTAAIKNEEQFLRGKFGERYDDYRKARADLPVSHRRFSWRQALANGEHRTLAGFVLVVLLLAAKATYNGSFGWPPANGSGG